MLVRISRLALLFSLTVCISSNLHAQSAVTYSNITTFSGTGFSNGGSTNISGNTITRLVADDIVFGNAFAAGLQIDSITFSVANFNSVAVTARPIISLYADIPAVAPGVLLANFTLNATSFNPVSVILLTLPVTPSNALVTPGPGVRIWAGLSFDDNNGATGATLAQMDNLGQGLFNPPTVGSSQDLFFLSTGAGVGNTSNPAGGLLFFGGSPVANFGWEFSAVVAVPEPMTWALIGLGTMGSLALGMRYRRQQRNMMDRKITNSKVRRRA